MNSMNYKNEILQGTLDKRFVDIYGKKALDMQKKRYVTAIEAFESIYGANQNIELFSVAGRTEIAGNHTDHNHGCVVAASIDLDIIAVAAKTDDTIIRIKSEGFPEDCVDLAKYTMPLESLFGKSSSLIAGVADGFKKADYKVGGFVAYTTSNVLKGSGMSSSAAFEDMVGNIFNHFYNNGNIDNIEIAKISQYAENEFFGKPCGLMDQVACAAGGIVAIDFNNPKKPIVNKLGFDLNKVGYNLCITNTGGNHADLTADYASVPSEMKSIAQYFNHPVLREVNEQEVFNHIAILREKFGDRAVMRALHFYEENRRVQTIQNALENNDLKKFLDTIIASGKSSFCYLQNVYTTKNVSEQGLSLALMLSEKVLGSKKAAWRVHGGGFAGTIQAFVPEECVEEYRKTLDAVFGENRCMVLRIRPYGAIKF